MAKEKEQAKKPDDEKAENLSIKRRTLLKALAGVPVFGALAYEVISKRAYDLEKKNTIIKELGLEGLNAPVVVKNTAKGDLIKIGIVGCGNRSTAHFNGLGYMHPSDVEKRQINNTLQSWLEQEDLNVAVTGICDVFELHAEKGLATARNETRAGGAKPSGLPVKRYANYEEMLASKDIDAIMIATPDHSHAAITVAAAKAGKHVYCEKAPCHSEQQMNEVYAAVKGSSIVYQLGHQVPQSTVFKQAKEILEKNILGKITLVECTTNRNSADGAWVRHLDKTSGKPKPGDKNTIDWNQWLSVAPQVPFDVERFYNWTKYFDYDIGLIGQLFTHEFDCVNQLLHIGIPKSVVSSGGIYYWKDGREIPDILHCVFEYPDSDLTLLYSGSLANSRSRGRVFMGHDASMELGNTISIAADANSTRYKDQIARGIINPGVPMISLNPSSGQVDAVTSATEKYYAARGLTTTSINGRSVDVTHLHIKEWIDCMRNGGTPSANIEMAYQEGITITMAHQAYVQQRKVEWDAVNKKIV